VIVAGGDIEIVGDRIFGTCPHDLHVLVAAAAGQAAICSAADRRQWIAGADPCAVRGFESRRMRDERA
jgi:hypothetical protein